MKALTVVRNNVNRKVTTATLLMAALLSPVASFAALDAAVDTLIDNLVTDVGLLFAATVVLWAAIRGFVAVYKLGNKFISKAGA